MKYWKGIDDLIASNSDITKKQPVEHDISLISMLKESSVSNRRDFLKVFGFSVVSSAVLASCERKVNKAIPYLIKPEQITPGNAYYYATSFFDGDKYCSILARVVDGRPVKIEGNELSGVTKGGTSAIVQAALLGLYDDTRYHSPLISGKPADWEEADRAIIKELKKIKETNGTIVILSPSIISPSTKLVISEFTRTYPSTQHIIYDAVSSSGILKANEICFGKRVIPAYNFDKQSVVVSFGADFLGTWLSPVEFTKQFMKTRKLDNGEKSMSYHIHLESGLSLTGSNADKRIPVKPSEEAVILGNLYNYIAEKTGNALVTVSKSDIDIAEIGEKLLANMGQSLVISGSNNTEIQCIVNQINDILKNYGTTIDLTLPLYTKQGNDSDMLKFIDELNNKKIDAVLFYDVNPVYDYPDPAAIQNGLKNVSFSVSFATVPDETSELVQYVCPDHHFLESWNDFNPKEGKYSLAQPCINPLFNTRQAQESLLKWSGRDDTSYPGYMKDYWEKNLYKPNAKSSTFDLFWNKCVQDGVFEQDLSSESQPQSVYNVQSFSKHSFSMSDELELQLYESVGIGTGKHAGNPWLQELPDPVSKVTWDNYAAVSIKYAEKNNLKSGDLIKINNIRIPVLIQPGQANNTISVALGYGRTIAGKAAKNTGVNAYPFITISENRELANGSITVEKTGRKHEFAITQSHDSMEGRPIVRETTLENYLVNPASGNEMHEKVEKHLVSLYKEHEFKGHHWVMAIDLNSCTGCNACIVGCSAENNVPVVGKEEVRRAHEMHWIRIDRYYSGNPENPETIRQPVMCQHCDNAPCENVCPVAATPHSSEGLNQMIYNRCIGTRYCNNNCPYKVRRFNWFDYTMADAIPNNTKDPLGMTNNLPRMVLNPDVVVRSKGVIEKCSMCVQRIQEKKLTAKLENRALQDGDIKTACQQACPADAIVFGDINDKNSKVYKLFQQKRRYHLLEELHTLPSVGYLTKVRNKG